MPPDAARQLRPRMTMRQFGVFVVFAAIAMALLIPAAKASLTPWDLAIPAAFELPYLLLLPTVFLVRRGPLKNWAMAALSGIPLVAFAGFVNYLAIGGLRDGVGGGGTITALLVVFLAIADAIFVALVVYLGRRVFPVSCPHCGRWAMLRDVAVPRRRDFPRVSVGRSCLACGCRFRRVRGGPWVDVDALPPRSPQAARPARPELTKDDPR